MKIIVITLFVLIAIGITLKFLFFNNKKKKKDETKPTKKEEFNESLNKYDNIVANMNMRKTNNIVEKEISQQNSESEQNKEKKEDNNKIEKETKDKNFDLKSAIIHKSILKRKKKKIK